MVNLQLKFKIKFRKFIFLNYLISLFSFFINYKFFTFLLCVVFIVLFLQDFRL